MVFTIALIVISALLLLIIGINIYQQHKERMDSERRHQLQKQRAIIDETESVLANVALFPCSNDVVLVLYKRLLQSLEVAVTFSKNQQLQDYQRRLVDLQTQINQLEGTSSPTPSIDSVQIPDNDKQLIMLVQLLKKLKAILRAEHNKGKVDPKVFTNEENRINNMQLRINVDAMLTRGKSAKNMKQYGSAKQLLHKALSTLNAIKVKNPEDRFVGKKLEEVKALLEEINGQNERENTPADAKKKESDDLDMLFQPKKKW